MLIIIITEVGKDEGLPCEIEGEESGAPARSNGGVRERDEIRSHVQLKDKDPTRFEVKGKCVARAP